MSDTGLICRKTQMLAYPTKIIFDGEKIKDEDFTYYDISADPLYAYKFETKKTSRSTVITFGENTDSSRPYGISDDNGNIETSKYPRIDIDYDEKFNSTFKTLYLNPLSTYRTNVFTSFTSDTAYVVIVECCPETDTLVNVDADGNLNYGTPKEYPYKYHTIPPYYYNGITTEKIKSKTYLKLSDPQIVYGKDTSDFNGVISEIIIGSGIEYIHIGGCNSLTKVDVDTAYRLKRFSIYGCMNIKSITVPDGVETVSFSHLYSLESLQLPDTIRHLNLGSWVKLFIDSVWDGNTVQDNGLKINNICCHIGSNLESQASILSTSKVILNETTFYPFDFTTEYLSKYNCMYVDVLQSVWTKKFISSCNFDSAIYIGSRVFETDDYTIYKGENLCHANFGNNTEQVEFADMAFAGSGLKTIVLPRYKKKIGREVLSGTEIETLNIPDTWDNIDPYSFRYTSNLSIVTIPKSVKQIGAEAFARTQLKQVTIARDCIYAKSAFPSDCIINYYDD